MRKRFDRILEQLELLLPNDVADILLVKHGTVHSVYWRGYEKFGLEQTIESVTYNLSDTANLRLIKETGRPLAIPNVEQYAPWVSRPGLEWIKSQASAPIWVGNQIVGFLNINSSRPGVYTQQEAERLQLFADQTAAEFENFRLREQTHRVVLERQKTEQTLQETLLLIERAKREWETTVDSLSQLVCLLDEEGRIVRGNRTVARWGLAQVTQVKGKHFHELLHPGCRGSDCYLNTCWNQAWTKLKQGQPIECEAEDKILNRYLNLQLRPISTSPDEQIANFAVLVINDITVRKRTEAELRLTQARNQALLNAIPDLMFRVNQEGTFLDLLPAKDMLLPLTPALLGKKLKEVFPPKGAEEAAHYIRRALQTGETQVFEYQLLVEDQLRDYEFRLVASGHDEVLAIVRDITQRKQTEAELKRYRDHLEEVIEDRSVMLLRANEQLQQEIEERKQVEEELRRRNQELALLNHIVVGSAAQLGLDTILETTCRELAAAINLPLARAVLLDPSKNHGRIVAQYLAGNQGTMEIPETINVEQDPAHQFILQHKQALVVDNVRVHADPALTPIYQMMLSQETASLLMLPLIIEAEVVGSLSLMARLPHHFSQEEISLAQVVANQVSDALAQTPSVSLGPIVED